MTKNRLRQVLINLLGNAIKFTDRGQVLFKVNYHQDKIRFQIEDTGSGIKEDDLINIFLPFGQANNPSYKKEEGTGLGLTISQHLINMMGGDLRVKSSLGVGSTFWFDLTLPIVSDWKQPIETHTQPIIGFKGPKRKVLVVDDKLENLSILVNLLGGLGFEMLEANNGKEALEQAILFQPDIILMDIRMPVLNGLEATQQIRQSPKLKDIPIIAISASAFKEDREKSIAAGCNSFISKPIKLDPLLQEMQIYLQLEWLYEQDTDQERVSSPLVGLPEKEATVLYKLAQRGDIKGVKKHIAYLEQLDDKYQTFINMLRQFARYYQMEKIQSLLKPYINQ